jgi:hypothetical protein
MIEGLALEESTLIIGEIHWLSQLRRCTNG